ncbi:unnamed protein product [Cuscuta epithymum]|uniref:RING-type E3 ubiquitin transferase n=1 Tax=Cuscuta epithymum TaxID=186058 RepID=A0AAV0F1I2_9ASTE|nr:unnamed protein product [Cuscuta epithymum]CAH9129385.1 unnamed protein product [Cuscuta epithymum]CAH9148981.1 unnamed protein product [Cuscuta epithymum]
MAKTGVVDGADSSAARAAELKRELQRAVKAIVSEEGSNVEAIDRAHESLSALRDLRTNYPRRRSSFREENSVSPPPDAFRCPLSKELMRDPVILSTGQTYDRPFIQKWLNSGNRTCPRTQQVLTHTILTPNHLVSDLINQWCKNNGIQLPDPHGASTDDAVTEADRDHFLSLLGKMSSTLPEQKGAARELRLLTKRMPSFRALFGESVDAVPQLLGPLSQLNPENDINPDLQEDLITTLLNLSIHDNNKQLVAETPMVIPLLMSALRSGTVETRSNSAATLFTLSALDSNKSLIGQSGALKPLIELLDEGHSLAIKDAASAIFNLCILHENKVRAVRDGAVGVLLKKIEDGVHVDELLSILAMLSTNQRAVEEIGELGGVPCLLSLMRESSCERNKENCVAILYSICFMDRSKLRAIREAENMYRTISQLAQNGTSRAKRKASGILGRLSRGHNLTHTA